MTHTRFGIVAVSAVILGSVFLSACGGSKSDDAATTSTTATTGTTEPPVGAPVKQKVSALPESEAVIGPALVSEQITNDSGASSGSSNQVSPSDVARQEQLLSDLQAKRNDQGILVSVPELVLFDFGKSTLKPDATASLDKIAELLKFYPQQQISVQGHTDNVGSDAANQKLSEDRANAVKQALVTRGANASKLDAVGFGETRPVAPNTDAAGKDNPDGRTKNRRVEVVFNAA